MVDSKLIIKRWREEKVLVIIGKSSFGKNKIQNLAMARSSSSSKRFGEKKSFGYKGKSSVDGDKSKTSAMVDQAHHSRTEME